MNAATLNPSLWNATAAFASMSSFAPFWWFDHLSSCPFHLKYTHSGLPALTPISLDILTSGLFVIFDMVFLQSPHASKCVDMARLNAALCAGGILFIYDT